MQTDVYQSPTQIDVPSDIPLLRTFYLYLTGGCNLACKHCYITPTFQKNGGTGGHLDPELLEIAVKQALPLGLVFTKLTGGEPLLHPEFLRIVDILTEHGIDLSMETNGILMTEDIAKYVARRAHFRSISLSLDGANAETHDRFRGVKGSFERTNNAVRYLVAEGFRPQIIMSIHAGNVDQIEDLVLHAQSLGAGSVKFNLIQPTGRGENMMTKGQVIDINRLVEIGHWVEGTLQKQVNISLHYSWPMAFFHIDRLLVSTYDLCGIFNILGILSTGHFAMCGVGMHINELVYGKSGVDNLRDVWFNHPTLVRLREDLPKNLDGVCGECIHKTQCLGSCVAGNYFTERRLNAAFWFCKQAEEQGLFPSSRLVSPERGVPHSLISPASIQ